MMTQNEVILRHLREYGQITSMDAIMRYGCTRLAARIAELKKDGYDIESEKPKGKNYAVYRLVEQ